MRPELQGERLGAVAEERGWDVIFTRIETVEGVEVVAPETRLQFGQRLTVVGTREAVEEVRDTLGRPADEGLTADRSTIDHRRIFVSSPEVVGRTLAELRLPQRFGAVITRVRRGDVELMPHADMVLELGDRVRAVAPRERIEALSTWFGDSYHALSQVNVLTFSLGIALGMLR